MVAFVITSFMLMLFSYILVCQLGLIEKLSFD